MQLETAFPLQVLEWLACRSLFGNFVCKKWVTYEDQLSINKLDAYALDPTDQSKNHFHHLGGKLLNA